MNSVTVGRQFLAGLRLLAVLTLICGLLYPLAITAAAQVAAPGRADGSRLEADGKVVGSKLIGQRFEGREWFQPRPSAAGELGYDTLASAGSNLGPNNEELAAAVAERRAAYAEANQVDPNDVPVDALTASGSGLDPHISLENARLQAARVAQARGLNRRDVIEIVDQHSSGRALGVLGAPRVNVLELNAALARGER